MSLGARIGKAVAEIKRRGVSALAVALETFYRQPTDAFIDCKLGDFALCDEIVEEVLRGTRRNVEPACENHTCFKSYGRGGQSTVRALKFTCERGGVALI
jgi:hypothetical protein